MLFFSKKAKELKAQLDAEKYIAVKEYQNAVHQYKRKFSSKKRYTKAPKIT